jgi:hypothetical protein
VGKAVIWRDGSASTMSRTAISLKQPRDFQGHGDSCGPADALTAVKPAN